MWNSQGSLEGDWAASSVKQTFKSTSFSKLYLLTWYKTRSLGILDLIRGKTWQQRERVGLVLMAWFLESLQWYNHWTSLSTKLPYSKRAPTKCLWHALLSSTKNYRMYRTSGMDWSFEGCIQLRRNFLKLKDILLSPHCCLTPLSQSTPSMSCCMNTWRDKEHAISSVTDPVPRAPYSEQHRVMYGRTQRGGTGKLAQFNVNLQHPYIYWRTESSKTIGSSSSSSSFENRL